MRRLLLVLEGAFGSGEPILREGLPGLTPFLADGRAWRLEPPPVQPIPESAYLGLAPDRVRMAEGPLIVSALGVDPPERTLHFRVDPLDERGEPLFGEGETVRAALRRLETKRLLPIPGEDVHGLVLEGWPDLGTSAPGGPYPDGEDDRLLRRFIDDSANLLRATEAHRTRVDEGKPGFGPLWPWAHGVRGPVPNLALERGEIAAIDALSLRLRGLSRLAGYPGRGSDGAARIVVRSVAGFADPDERLHALRRAADRLDRDLLDRLTLLLPGEDGGLALVWDRERPERPDGPFDERRIEDATGPVTSVSDLAEAALTGVSS